ncbi:MAG: hypothetical protein HY909_25850 [Deltaproteobacteria bacterium]|nr:hypothetical protein [Deltaproteobacteria bacterium]
MDKRPTRATREEAFLEAVRGAMDDAKRERRRQDAALRRALEDLERAGALSDPEDLASARALLAMLDEAPRRMAPSAVKPLPCAALRA